MIAALRRKARQVLDDPTLRLWLARRLLRLEPGPPAFQAHKPPYLPRYDCAARPRGLETVDAPAPDAPIELALPGETVVVAPDAPGAVFERGFADTETLLGLHRFAWLPLRPFDASWTCALWRAWMDRFAVPDQSWAWHPYTAAERAINILDHGPPGPEDRTLEVLAAHGPAIMAGLEYFGEHHTSNHLANDGRGLYLLGLALGMEDCAEAGAAIMLEEAKRIFLPSGMLREGSSHYHLLLTRQYASAWLAARRHGRGAEAGAFEDIVRRAMAVIPGLVLPGGMPLVGDISPDCPPSHLAGFLPRGGGGWTAGLDDKDRALIEAMKDQPPVPAEGWLQFRSGHWSGLWRGPPEGWSHMPGHGHQDVGGFELHYEQERVFVDPGRGAYGEDGDAALYRSARVHNSALVDGHDPYPPNRPYYSDGFRARIGGAELAADDGVTLRHEGFGRLRGVGAQVRRWRFEKDRMILTDRIEGTREATVTRTLVTPMFAEFHDGALMLDGRFRIAADAPLRLEPMTVWHAYGEGRTGTAIVIEDRARLPFEGTITVEVA